MSKREFVSRRRLLQVGAAGGAGAALASVLAACGETQIVEVERVVTKEVVKVVTKEVPVEKVVEKIVTKEVPVEKVVTKVVTKEVPTMVEAGQPVKGGTLNFSAGGKLAMNHFNQLTVISSSQDYVTYYVWLSLWYGDTWGDGPLPESPGRWGPGVANKFDEVEKDRVYNFHVNPDVKWHDGKPVIADDVLCGFKMAMDKRYQANLGKKFLKPLKGAEVWGENPTDDVEDAGFIKKIDEMTVQLQTEQPDANFWVDRTVQEGNVPHPKHLYGNLNPETALKGEPYGLNPPGNGPVKFVRYVDQQFAEMEANPDFAYGAPWFDRYIVRYGDPDALDAACEAGELDFHRASTIEAFGRLSQLPHLRPYPQRSPFVSAIYLNQKNFEEKWPDVNRPLLTEAMVLALDRDTLNTELMAGTYFVSDYLFEHVNLMRDPPADAFVPRPYDPEAAKELVAESGWDTSDTIKWVMWSAPQPLNLAMVDYWKQIGVNVEFERIDVSAVIDEFYMKRTHDMTVSNVGGDQAPHDAWLRLRCGAFYDAGGYNHSNICDPELDALYEKMLASETKEEMREKWLDISRYIHASGTMPVGCLWRGSLRNIYHRRVQGTWWMQMWYMNLRSPVERMWLDPRWDKTTYSG